MTTDDARRAQAARLKAERERRGWGVRRMARFLRDAVDDHQKPELPSFVTYVKRWESGNVEITDTRYRSAYAHVLDIPETDLFGPEPDVEATTFPRLPIMTGPRQISKTILVGPERSDIGVMEAFRVADRQVGGGHLYHAVMSYLQTALAPRLFSEADNDGRTLFSAAGALTEMVGWMAHDAGDDSMARRHFGRSLDLATIGGDRHLQAHIHASMSHLFVHTNEPIKAISVARRGRKVLANSAPNPMLNAHLLAMEARSLAALRKPQECVETLHEAEELLANGICDTSSPWVSRFDEASLASEKARCMRQIGVLQEAEEQARKAVSLRSSTHIRSQAFGRLILAKVLIAQDRKKEACTVVQEVLNATESLSSYLVVEQLREVRDLLMPYHSDREVTEFLRYLSAVLRERLVLYRNTR